MVEFYKEVARYRADIQHAASGKMIDYSAIVSEGPNEGEFSIRHSHTTQAEGAATPYFSNSFTRADSAAEAEALVRNWCDQIAGAHSVVEWPRY